MIPFNIFCFIIEKSVSIDFVLESSQVCMCVGHAFSISVSSRYTMSWIVVPWNHEATHDSIACVSAQHSTEQRILPPAQCKTDWFGRISRTIVSVVKWSNGFPYRRRISPVIGVVCKPSQSLKGLGWVARQRGLCVWCVRRRTHYKCAAGAALNSRIMYKVRKIYFKMIRFDLRFVCSCRESSQLLRQRIIDLRNENNRSALHTRCSHCAVCMWTFRQM